MKVGGMMSVYRGTVARGRPSGQSQTPSQACLSEQRTLGRIAQEAWGHRTLASSLILLNLRETSSPVQSTNEAFPMDRTQSREVTKPPSGSPPSSRL